MRTIVNELNNLHTIRENNSFVKSTESFVHLNALRTHHLYVVVSEKGELQPTLNSNLLSYLLYCFEMLWYRELWEVQTKENLLYSFIIALENQAV